MGSRRVLRPGTEQPPCAPVSRSTLPLGAIVHYWPWLFLYGGQCMRRGRHFRQHGNHLAGTYQRDLSSRMVIRHGSWRPDLGADLSAYSTPA